MSGNGNGVLDDFAWLRYLERLHAETVFRELHHEVNARKRTGKPDEETRRRLQRPRCPRCRRECLPPYETPNDVCETCYSVDCYRFRGDARVGEFVRQQHSNVKSRAEQQAETQRYASLPHERPNDCPSPQQIAERAAQIRRQRQN